MPQTTYVTVTLLLSIVLLSGGAFSQTSCVTGAEHVSSYANHPFEAEVQIVSIRTDANGIKRTNVIKELISRDKAARVRMERFFWTDPIDIDHLDESLATHDIVVYTCDRVFSLNPANHTANLTRLTPVVESTGRPTSENRQRVCSESRIETAPALGPLDTYTMLGHKKIGAVDAIGYRVERYPSVNGKESRTSPNDIHESWCSPELDTTLDDYRWIKDRDEFSLRFIRLDLVDPSPSLFEIPSGFRITNPDASQ